MKKIMYWTTYETYHHFHKQCARMTLVETNYLQEKIRFNTSDLPSEHFTLVTEENLGTRATHLVWQADKQQPIIEVLATEANSLAHHLSSGTLYQRYEKISGRTTDTKDELTLSAHLIETIDHPLEQTELNNKRVMVELKTSGTCFPKFAQQLHNSQRKAGVTYD